MPDGHGFLRATAAKRVAGRAGHRYGGAPGAAAENREALRSSRSRRVSDERKGRAVNARAY